jgi:hypothetical protein
MRLYLGAAENLERKSTGNEIYRAFILIVRPKLEFRNGAGGIQRLPVICIGTQTSTIGSRVLAILQMFNEGLTRRRSECRWCYLNERIADPIGDVGLRAGLRDIGHSKSTMRGLRVKSGFKTVAPWRSVSLCSLGAFSRHGEG